MRKKEFRLIKWVLAIAVVGVLAAIAIPAYQIYTVRARVAEGLALAASAKTSVAETAANGGTLPNSATEAGYTVPRATNHVSSIEIGEKGVITVTYTPMAGDGTLTLVPTVNANGELTWTCEGGTLDKKYRPAHCR